MIITIDMTIDMLFPTLQFSIAVVLAIFIDVHAEEDVVAVEDRQLPAVKVHKVYTNPEKV